MSAASQRRRSLGGAGVPPFAAGSSPAPGSAPRGAPRRRVSVAGTGGERGGEVTPGRAGPGSGALVAVAAERPGLRLMRIVGSQYDATVVVEAGVAKAEAKVKVRGAGTACLRL